MPLFNLDVKRFPYVEQTFEEYHSELQSAFIDAPTAMDVIEYLKSTVNGEFIDEFNQFSADGLWGFCQWTQREKVENRWVTGGRSCECYIRPVRDIEEQVILDNLHNLQITYLKPGGQLDYISELKEA